LGVPAGAVPISSPWRSLRTICSAGAPFRPAMMSSVLPTSRSGQQDAKTTWIHLLGHGTPTSPPTEPAGHALQNNIYRCRLPPPPAGEPQRQNVYLGLLTTPVQHEHPPVTTGVSRPSLTKGDVLLLLGDLPPQPGQLVALRGFCRSAVPVVGRADERSDRRVCAASISYSVVNGRRFPDT
jgi:hypothetical protein